MPFEAANNLASKHLIVQPSDLALNPPESYLYIQDGLMIACGALYILCYCFYMTRTIKDKTVAGPIEFLGLCQAYELFYAFETTTTTFELVSFLAWFGFDVTFTAIAIAVAYPREKRGGAIGRTVALIVAGLVFLRYLCLLFPDEREQVTAFWTGVVLQLPISVVSLGLLLYKRDTNGHSLEIWITRYLGCWTAYGLFYWRYINVPQNWSYVASPWSVWMIGITLAAETLFPFAYVWVWRHERSLRRKEKVT